MIVVRSRMLQRGRTVIPKAVRRRLGLKAGDLIRFHVTGKDAVTIAKVRTAPGNPFVGFDEWMSDEDEALYANL